MNVLFSETWSSGNCEELRAGGLLLLLLSTKRARVFVWSLAVYPASVLVCLSRPTCTAVISYVAAA